MTSNDLIKEFDIYCANKECDRICPLDRTLKCFAEYIVKIYKEGDINEKNKQK